MPPEEQKFTNPNAKSGSGDGTAGRSTAGDKISQQTDKPWNAVVATTEGFQENEIIGNRYRVLNPLGNGAMGFVYQGIDTRLNRNVAIKLLSAEAGLDDESRTRFESEAKMASTFNHPNVAAIYDYGIHEDTTPYIIMEFVDGQSLDSLLRQKGKLLPQEVSPVFKGVAEGLHHAHKRGVVHRDLKPGNVIITKDDTGQTLAKIVDFGLAKVVFGERAAKITKTGEVLGTPLYMSPEQITGQDLDGRSDVYSLGIMMFECLTGKVPFKGKDAMATAHLHVAAPVPTMDLLDSAEAQKLILIVARCLEKKRTDRFATSLELAEALAGPGEKITMSMKSQQALRALPQPSATPSSLAIGVVVLIATVVVFACGFFLADVLKAKPEQTQDQTH